MPGEYVAWKCETQSTGGDITTAWNGMPIIGGRPVITLAAPTPRLHHYKYKRLQLPVWDSKVKSACWTMIGRGRARSGSKDHEQ